MSICRCNIVKQNDEVIVNYFPFAICVHYMINQTCMKLVQHMVQPIWYIWKKYIFKYVI